VTLRATRPGGTGFALRATSVSLGSKASITFMLGSGPPISWVAAQVRPVTGDPDLFLSISGGRPAGLPGLFSSVAPNGLPDTVWAQMIPGISFPFVPIVTVFGFTATVTGFFLAGWVI
jgi:hypothetical protein